MPANLLLALPLAIPFATALAARLLPGRASEAAQTLGTTALLLAGLALALRVAADGPLLLAGLLYADTLSALLLVVVSLVGWLAGLYAVGYLRHDVAAGLLTPSQPRWFAFWYQLFLLTMLGVLLAENLGLMWAAVEATTLASALLVGFYGTRPAVEATWKYLLICTVGIVFALFGILLTYYAGVQVLGAEAAALSWRTLAAAAPRLDPQLVKLAFLFVLVGYGTKVGFAPLHTWLPDAHSQAPTPVSAVLSGVLLPCALYAILRFHVIAVGALGPSFSSNLLIGFGLLSAGVAVPFILIQQDLKRLLAYSSVEHMGVIAVAIGIGGPLGLFAALLHLVVHALGKALLFFVAGNLAQRYGTRQMARIHGAAHAMPFSGPTLLAGGLALAGAPPSGIFTSELSLLAAGVSRGQAFASMALLALLGLIFAGVLFHFSRMALGRPPRRLAQGERRRTALLVGAPLAAVALLGVYVPPPLARALEQAAAVVGQ